MARCECAGCGRLFTGVTPFDKHQRIAGGGIACADPETAVRRDGSPRFGVWDRLPDGRPVWGRGLLPGETLKGRPGRPGATETAAEGSPGVLGCPEPAQAVSGP